MLSRLLSVAAVVLAAVHPLQAQARPDSLAGRLTRELAPFLHDRATRDEFSGVVVVAQHGIPIFTMALGQADKEHNVPNLPTTRFNLGSMDKMFTAVAIAQLVEAGKLSVDATVGTYLPDYPNSDVAQHVTICQLLTHTSGLGDYFKRGYLRDRVRIEHAADLLRFFAVDSLEFRPGERMRYSNAGFAVLGAIIERVSGQTYFDYVQQHVFAPAGMTHTGFDDVSNPAGNFARSYGRPPVPPGVANTAARQPVNDQLEARGGPAGGGYSTASDLIAFGQALWAGKLVSKALVDEFTTGKVPMGPNIKYGFGFGDLRLGNVRMVGHNGGAPGVNAEFSSFPDSGYDVVVLSNYDPPAATAVIDKIREILAR